VDGCATSVTLLLLGGVPSPCAKRLLGYSRRGRAICSNAAGRSVVSVLKELWAAPLALLCCGVCDGHSNRCVAWCLVAVGLRGVRGSVMARKTSRVLHGRARGVCRGGAASVSTHCAMFHRSDVVREARQLAALPVEDHAWCEDGTIMGLQHASVWSHRAAGRAVLPCEDVCGWWGLGVAGVRYILGVRRAPSAGWRKFLRPVSAECRVLFLVRCARGISVGRGVFAMCWSLRFLGFPGCRAPGAIPCSMAKRHQLSLASLSSLSAGSGCWIWFRRFVSISRPPGQFGVDVISVGSWRDQVVSRARCCRVVFGSIPFASSVGVVRRSGWL